jgi:hypothetical protein
MALLATSLPTACTRQFYLVTNWTQVEESSGKVATRQRHDDSALYGFAPLRETNTVVNWPAKHNHRRLRLFRSWRRLPTAALGAEAVADVADRFDQEIDFGRRIVEIEAGSGAGRDAETVVQRLRAVVAGSDSDALLIEKLGDVVRMGVIEDEAHQAGAVLGRWT